MATLTQVQTDPSLLLKKPPPEDGVYPKMSEREYIDCDAVSFSRFKHFNKTAQHCYAYMTRPPDTKSAQELGSAIHVAILEPERFEEDYFQAPGGDKRSKGVKEAWRIAEEDHPGAIGLKPADWDTCRGARDAVWSRHAYAAALLGGEGFNECAYVWTDPGTQLKCKFKADRLSNCPDGHGAIIDIKSIVEATDRKITFAIRDFQYHVQGAHGIEGLNQLRPATRRFILIWCEKSRPYAVRVTEVSEHSMELGKRERRRFLDQYRQCIDSGIWPAYAQGLELVDVPDYEFSLEEQRNAAEDGDTL